MEFGVKEDILLRDDEKNWSKIWTKRYLIQYLLHASHREQSLPNEDTGWPRLPLASARKWSASSAIAPMAALTSRCISTTSGFRSPLHWLNVPFVMYGDTRNKQNSSSYIPNKGMIKRWEIDRHVKASLQKSFCSERFSNKLVLWSRRRYSIDLLVANCIQDFQRN